MKFNKEELKRIILNRRTIYPEQFSPEKVSRELIVEMLDNARWAPTHGMTQPWFFKIFTGKGIDKYIDFHSRNTNLKFDSEKFEKLKNRALRASAIITVIMKRQVSGKIRELEEVEAVACAVENMFLTATAQGLAFFWASGGLTYSQEMKTFLGISEQDLCLGSIFIGYPDIEWPHGHRKPVESFTEWIE